MNNKKLYQIIIIICLVMIWWIVISQINNNITQNTLIETNNNITNEVVENNNLTGKYDFVSEIWQLAFNYDTGNYIITESKVQEGSMIILILSKKSGWKIGNIWVFHNGGHSQTPRDGFWVDEARSVAMTQNLSWICFEMPPGLRDYCTEKENSNNIFYATVNGVYQTWLQQIEYSKKQRYLQNTLSEFPGILLTTEEVWLQYTWLLQSIVDSIIFFDIKQSDKKTYYGDGISFQYPSEANHIRRAAWFDEIWLLIWDNVERIFRVEYRWYNCKTFFTNRQTYNNISEINNPYRIITAEGDDFVWCLDTNESNSIAFTSNNPLQELIYNLKLKE
jgi:hypothetical protein